MRQGVVLSVMTHVMSGCVIIPISMSIPTQSPCYPQGFLLSHVFVASIFMCGPEVGRASWSFLPLTRTRCDIYISYGPSSL
jgi:hypothetical protein